MKKEEEEGTVYKYNQNNFATLNDDFILASIRLLLRNYYYYCIIDNCL